MRNRELKKLNRKELLEIVLEQSRQLEMLEAEGRIADIPALEEELKRENYRKRYGRTLRSTIYMLITVAAMAVLVATLWLPVLKIYGGSMTPTLANGEIVVSVKDGNFAQGDIIAFYYNNKILVKRVICGPGKWVNIDENGTVFVDGEPLYEPYLADKAFGQCDLDLQYQVPDARYFVMGDHRSTSVDSRATVIGCVAEEQIVGELVFRVWPLNEFGWLK
jgi:signal peptidase I